jgi:hypothetical protein
MPRAPGAPILELAITAWPSYDQKLWEKAFRPSDDPFDQCGPASHLAHATGRAMRSSYGIWLRFLSAMHAERLTGSPSERIDRELVVEYVAWRRRTCGALALASDLNKLRLAITYLCSGADLSWLQSIAKRLANQGAPNTNPPIG